MFDFLFERLFLIKNMHAHTPSRPLEGEKNAKCQETGALVDQN